MDNIHYHSLPGPPALTTDWQPTDVPLHQPPPLSLRLQPLGDFGAARPSSLSPTLPSPTSPTTSPTSPTGDIAERVHRIEALLGPREASPTKNLWFYKDGLRTPSSPPPLAPKPEVSLAGRMPVRQVSTAELTLSPRTVRRLGEPDAMTRSVSTVAVTLTNGHKLTTSFTGADEAAELSRSLCSLSPSLVDSSLLPDISGLVTPTLSTPPAAFPAARHRAPLGKPPALPPKTPTPASPPPRPASKELRLDDILSMCAEYERQIEEEQREARESLSLSPISRPPPSDTTPRGGDGPLSPSSPSSTLQAPRIKTNGSLPRDGKRLPSPSRSAPPTSPLTTTPEAESGIFTFERLGPTASPSSPILAPPRLSHSQEREEGRRSATFHPTTAPSTLLTHPTTASSPRTRIRTTLNRSSTSHTSSSSTSHTSSSETLKEANSASNSPASSLLRTSCPPSQFSLADYQGGKEGLMDTDKGPEELYTEAKEVLALVGGSPSESPCSTGARRPPRSKHDEGTREEVVPSAEAHHRLLIGTVMLSKHSGAALRSPAHQLKAERAAVLTELNRAAAEVAELSTMIEEAERSVDLECSLIGAEMRGNEVDVANLSMRLADLTAKEGEMAQVLSSRRERNNRVMEEARARLDKAETELDELEETQNRKELDTDAEMELLEQIKLKHEHLEAERKVFEDLEFKTMEEEAQLEAEIEEVSMVMNKTQNELEAAETVVSEMELQKAEITVSQDVSILHERRETVAGKLEAEKRKLGELEARLKDLLTSTASRRSSEDSGTITWSDEDSGRTVVAREVGRHSGRRSSESTSDLPQDSTDSRTPSPVPPPTLHNSRPALAPPAATPSPSPPALMPRPKRGGVERSMREVERGSEEVLSSGDERPLSGTETGSLWGPGDGSWAGVSMRRPPSSRGGQRPLTRYLPVTQQEGFDLRAHIETAGHQIELCKHVVVNSCSCRGYLTKQGTRLKGWNRRWFVFDRNKRTLVYYGDKSEGKAKGGIYFHSISEVYVDHQKTQGGSQRATFIMKTNDRKYSLTAPSQEAMRIWVDVLFTGAEGYQEFQDME